MEFSVVVKSERASLVLFDEYPANIHDHVFYAMDRIVTRMVAAIQAAEPVKTGAMRSETGGRVYDHNTRIAAVAGVRVSTASEAKKALALEFGSRGVPIMMHRVNTSRQAVSRRLSRPLKPTWERVPTLTPRRFLRGPAEALRSSSIAEVTAAVEAANEQFR
jgi:hypothetical protein